MGLNKRIMEEQQERSAAEVVEAQPVQETLKEVTCNLIPSELLVTVLEYLANRPIREAQGLFNSLSSCTATIKVKTNGAGQIVS